MKNGRFSRGWSAAGHSWAQRQAPRSRRSSVASRELLQAQGSRPSATADAVIVLWMAGGMAQTETWDPKRYTPFEPGVRTERVLSTFPSIDTAVDNIKISQGLERVARVMDRGAIIRTFQAADLGYILHSRHQYHWHTGYIPPQTVAMPHIGSVICQNARSEESDRAAVHLPSARTWKSAARAPR